MDQQLDETLNLDGTIDEDDPNSTTLGQMSSDMELSHIEEGEMMMMDAEESQVIEDFALQGLPGPDMPILGGEDGIIEGISHHQRIVTSLDMASPETIIPDFQGMERYSEEFSQLSDNNHTAHLDLNDAIQQMTSTLTPSVPVSSAVKHVMIAPKQTQIKKPPTPMASTVTSQWNIAPRPITINSTALGKKVVSLGNMQTVTRNTAVKQVTTISNTKAPTTLFGTYGSGKQLVLLSAGKGQPQRLKLVQNSVAPHPTVQFLKSEKSFQSQLTNKKVPVPAVSGNKPVMAKMLLQGASEGGATKAAPAAGSSAPRYISLQQAQQMGLFANTPASKLVTFSSSQSTTPRLAKLKQSLVPVKSPTKILPAPAQGQVKRIILTSAPQSVMLKPTISQTTASSTESTVTSVGSSVSSVSKQIHQIHVPGKGVQYVRLLPAPSAAPAPAPAPSAPSDRAIISLGGGKTLLLADSQAGLLPMTGGKVGIPPLSRGSAGAASSPAPAPALSSQHVLTSSAINKITSKPQQKLVRIAPVPQTLIKVVKAPQTVLPSSGMAYIKSSFATLTKIESSNVERHLGLEEAHGQRDSEMEARMETEEMDYEDSKVGIRELLVQAPAELRQHIPKMEGTIQYEVPIERDPSQEEESNSTDASYEESQDADADTHMAPAMITNGELAYIDIKSEYLPQYEINEKLIENLAAAPPPGKTQRSRKPCNCTKSQCLKLYCDCFANGEFCHNCNCNNCCNNLENEEERQKAIRSCLDRNPSAFRPKIGKAVSSLGPEAVRRHNKGCNCKRSGCLKNYCECYEAKIACSGNCKCVGCRNVEDSPELTRARCEELGEAARAASLSPPPPPPTSRNATDFITSEVVEACCQCMLAACAEGGGGDPVRAVLLEFGRCLQDVISSVRQSQRPQQLA